jgi:hypothetical protein
VDGCFLFVCVSAPQTQLADGMSANKVGDPHLVKTDQVICIPSFVCSIAEWLPCAFSCFLSFRHLPTQLVMELKPLWKR